MATTLPKHKCDRTNDTGPSDKPDWQFWGISESNSSHARDVRECIHSCRQALLTYFEMGALADI